MGSKKVKALIESFHFQIKPKTFDLGKGDGWSDYFFCNTSFFFLRSPTDGVARILWLHICSYHLMPRRE